MNTPTDAQLKRTTDDLCKYAKEVVRTEIIKGCLYAYGSELACYRIMNAYKNRIQDVTVSYSENLKTWYFCLEAKANVQDTAQR